MFQTFETRSDPTLAAARVSRLREEMQRRKLDAYLIPRADEHQGEYVPPCAERLHWLTGFSGSAGSAVVTHDTATVFVDGRYTVQARQEVDTKIFEIVPMAKTRAEDWIPQNLSFGARIGFDPKLFTIAQIERLQSRLKPHGIKVTPVATNLIDKLWGKDRPAPPAGPIIPHPLEFAGTSSADKVEEVQKRLADDEQDVVVLTSPDSIAWLLNARGSDVAHNPVFLSFAIVPRRGKVELFVDPKKVDKSLREHLRPVAKILAPDKLAERLSDLKSQKKRVRLDPNAASWFFAQKLGGARRIARGSDPCTALKAIKNATEIAGMRMAHERDGVAVSQFLCWLDREAAKGSLDEITAAQTLEDFRRQTNLLREISFDTISGSGPNGAIVHYRVSTQSNRQLKQGELFLVDSGAQYQDGTTDITRTIAIGKPTREMIERFTRVLKGHIAIATASFPKGTCGRDLDPMARRALWEASLDYDHGTGHGVGSFLSVHEGPASISKAGAVPLQPGMILSNEPGYYKEGAYGIRIENLVLVQEPKKISSGDREMLSFETLTLAPIDRRLIDPALLTDEERAWLNAYHDRVRKTLSPLVDRETKAWLKAATAVI
ncbi:Aminopeptidase [Candidatus Filomicrobium marinum]|uniref:Aminopeptidase n=1 Tax=Candidatus Filomicrobium marinum TaxID=1608628 RepID=A0A0D6JLN5_9HYPH|nr:aminopeptidase P family protein [Candidatus Filomicrobium marinum]CFX63711.1 Aminopeptidase [Candidatus Filomicrobium marinum]CPR22560.1 Aminopeptidase [Candidatus Filomicrobium marinum]